MYFSVLFSLGNHADDLSDGINVLASGDETTPAQSPKPSRGSQTAVVAAFLGLTVGLLILAGLILAGVPQATDYTPHDHCH